MEIDISAIKEWKAGLDKHLVLDFYQGGDESGKNLGKFCDALERHAGMVTVHTHRVMEGDYSHLRINQQIKYYAIPEGRELLPFLELLSGQAASAVPRASAEKALLVDIPCGIDVFISRDCPFCPDAVKKIAPLAIINPKITVRIIDGVEYPVFAEKYEIKSVPAVIACDDFRWTGTIPFDEVLDSMISRDPGKLGAASFENMIADGKAQDIARMMIEENRIFSGFIDVLVHEKWPVRLGAMVAAETLCESRPDIASLMVEPLARRFYEVDDTIKGDIIQIMGETRSRAALDFFMSVEKSDISDEIREIIRETKDLLNI